MPTLPPPITIRGQPQKDRAISAVLGLTVDEKRPVVIRFSRTQLTRTEKQRHLYFLWIGQLANGTGYRKDELHDRYKKGIVFDLLKSRPSTAELVNPVYEMYQELIDLYRSGATTQAEKLAEILKGLLSTNFLTVEENAEVLRVIEQDAAATGVTLTDPDGYRK